MKVVALEEHFAFSQIVDAWRSADALAGSPSLASFAQGTLGERLFSTDYPYQQASREAVAGLFDSPELSEIDRENIGCRNWQRLCSESSL